MEIKKVKKIINITGISLGIAGVLAFSFAIMHLSNELEPELNTGFDFVSFFILLTFLLLPLAAWIKLVLGISGFIEGFVQGYRGDDNIGNQSQPKKHTDTD